LEDLRGQYECGEIEDFMMSHQKIYSDIIEKFGQEKGELYFKELEKLL